MARKLNVNPTLPIESQRTFRQLIEWAQEDEGHIDKLKSGAGVPNVSNGPIGPAFGTQQSNLLQSLTATAPQIVTPAPAHHNSPGQPKQIATDTAGNFYWCYGPNQWARIGSGGYSNTF